MNTQGLYSISSNEKIRNIFEIIDSFIFSTINKAKCLSDLIKKLTGDSKILE